MKLGLCLSGGGVKGAAHIGAIKALEEENIQFEYVGGTSSGSIVATLYAVGYTAEEIYRLFKEYGKKIKYVDGKKIIKTILGLILKGKIVIDGLNSGEAIEKIVRDACKARNIQNIGDITMPLAIPSVNLHNGKVYLFTSMKSRKTLSDKMKYINDIEIGRAVRASCSYPGVFSPCPYRNKQLIDGGIRENTPWRETKEMGAERVLSIVFQNERKQEKHCYNIIDVISNSLSILGHELSLYELCGAECLLEISAPNISLLDVEKIDELYELGYKQTKENMRKIKNELGI